MVAEFHFPRTQLPESIERLRREVRDFIAEERRSGALPRPGNVGMRVSFDLTRKLAQRGWIGMTWPKKYGGHERSTLERYAVTEELLSAGAPVRAHWIPDRQTGPLLLKFGTEEQKLKYLPRIAQGACIFSIGLSEPNSGSDLAALRTRAERVAGGWSVSGTKLWNSNSHNAHYMITLCRTEPPGEDRHRGISQLIVSLSAPGVTVRPIINLAGEHDFNEVVLDGVWPGALAERFPFARRIERSIGQRRYAQRLSPIGATVCPLVDTASDVVVHCGDAAIRQCAQSGSSDRKGSGNML
jgi:alkylation response protein AidB-like acyl-CoA dehydrogenase